jgi:CheY-specific phosphatase CheX
MTMSFEKMDIRKSFIDSVVDTFAEMAFIDVISEDNYDGKINYSGIMGLKFSDPGEGRLLFFMSKECKKQLVENIYGEDWEILNDMDIDDCLLEILNVLAGEFLKNLYGKDKKIIMSFPRLFFDDEEISNVTNTLKFIFNAEGAMFKAQVSLNV